MQVEGELGGFVVGLPRVGRLRDELVGVIVEVGEGVEQDVADLGALVLVEVVGIDAVRVGDVVLDGAVGRSLGAVAGSGGAAVGLLAAGGEGREGAGGEAALHEVTAGDAVVRDLSHKIPPPIQRAGQPICPSTRIPTTALGNR